MDISKCNGEKCDKKENCYRFTCPANEYRQSYFGSSPMSINGECEFYWEVIAKAVIDKEIKEWKKAT